MTTVGVAYVSALVLAVVFLFAGVAKLRRRDATTRAFAALGLASPGAMAAGVPGLEIGLALALVVAPAWAGIAALAVLAGFSTFLGLAIHRRQAFGCGCFGAARPTPAGVGELVRNAFLALAAAIATAAPGPAAPTGGDVLVVLLGVGVAWVSISVAGRRWPPTPPGTGLVAGTAAPILPGLHYGEGRRTLVAFVTPTCEGCAGLLASLRRVEEPGLQVQVLELDDATAGDFQAFGVRATPSVVLINGAGLVLTSGPARTEGDLVKLLR